MVGFPWIENIRSEVTVALDSMMNMIRGVWVCDINEFRVWGIKDIGLCEV